MMNTNNNNKIVALNDVDSGPEEGSSYYLTDGAYAAMRKMSYGSLPSFTDEEKVKMRMKIVAMIICGGLVCSTVMVVILPLLGTVFGTLYIHNNLENSVNGTTIQITSESYEESIKTAIQLTASGFGTFAGIFAMVAMGIFLVHHTLGKRSPLAKCVFVLLGLVLVSGMIFVPAFVMSEVGDITYTDVLISIGIQCAVEMVGSCFKFETTKNKKKCCRRDDDDKNNNKSNNNNSDSDDVEKGPSSKEDEDCKTFWRWLKAESKGDEDCEKFFKWFKEECEKEEDNDKDDCCCKSMWNSLVGHGLQLVAGYLVFLALTKQGSFSDPFNVGTPVSLIFGLFRCTILIPFFPALFSSTFMVV